MELLLSQPDLADDDEDDESDHEQETNDNNRSVKEIN